jgi:hypothetical protein
MALEKPGTNPEITQSELLWLRGLLRYTRDIELATPGVNGLPNMTTLFCGMFTTERGVSLLYASPDHADHSQYIDGAHGSPVLAPSGANVALKVVNSASKEINLMLEGYASRVPEDQVGSRLFLLNHLRSLKREPPTSLDRADPIADPWTLYEVEMLAAKAQGERLSADGRHVGEGHPVVSLPDLRNFESLAGIPNFEKPPATIRELLGHLTLSSML